MTRRRAGDAIGALQRNPALARIRVVADLAVLASTGIGVPCASAANTTSNATASPQAEPTGVAAPQPTQSNMDRERTGEASVEAPRGVLAVALALESPEGCGTLAQFVERLQARLLGIRMIEYGAERKVLARIESLTDGTVRATMTLLQPNGRAAERVIAANSCAEAMEALALITAVTLEPLVVRSEPSNAAATEPTTLPPARSNTLPLHHANERDLDGQPSRRARTAPNVTRFGLGAGYAAFRGPSPGLLHGFELSARVLRHDGSNWSPSVRLGLAYTVHRGYAAAGGVADFAFASATLDLCPGRGLWQFAELRGCALLQGGVMTARGRATLLPERHHRPFYALGTAVELVLLPQRSVAVPIRLSLAVPTARDRYAFDPAAFYTVPAYTVGLTVGLEVRLP